MNCRICTLLFLAVTATLHGGRAGGATTIQDAVDYTRLKAALGATLPTGQNVPISQVEGGGANFMADGTAPAFNGTLDAHGIPTLIVNATPASGGGISGHATNTVAGNFYGDISSMAPGANAVTIYEAGRWLEEVTNYKQSVGPQVLNFRVQNHSWITTLAPGEPTPPAFTEHPDNVKVLQRFDYAMEQANDGEGMTAVVGVNNNANPMPYLLSHSYNSIAVGRSDGVHSSGLTLADNPSIAGDNSYGPGRSKPDLVAPLSSSSATTAFVSGAATMLYESAGTSDAARNEVMKATLLAGATKSEFPSWSRTAAQPLDDTFGAGELNIFNSYAIQLGGKRAGSATTAAAPAGSYGWDYRDRQGTSTVGDIFYNFVVPEGSTASDLSIVLSWNVKVTDTDAGPNFTPAHSLQNLDLRLYESSGGVLGQLVDASTSAVDSVEHIYIPSTLDAGMYTLKVSGLANWDYGLAWRMTTRFDEPSADFNGDGAVNGGDFLVWQRHLGTILGATNAQGDADGDGDVDELDLDAWKLKLMPTSQLTALAARQVANVPEPATIALVAGGIFGAIAVARRSRRARQGDF